MSEPYRGGAPFEAGSDTSRAAAESLPLEVLVVQEQQVYMYLYGIYPDAATDKMIEIAFDMEKKHSSVSRARRMAFIHGRVRDAGVTENPKSKRMAHAHQAILPTDPAYGVPQRSAREIKLSEAREKITQAWQVVGWLLDRCGLFDSAEGQRALDYFADDTFEKDFLPWPRTFDFT